MTPKEWKEVEEARFFSSAQVVEAEQRRDAALAARALPKTGRAARVEEAARAWANESATTEPTTDSAEPERAPVTDSRSIVLDGRWNDRQREILSQVMREAEPMPLADKLTFLEGKGREHRDEKDRGGLSLGVEIWRRADALKKRR